MAWVLSAYLAKSVQEYGRERKLTTETLHKELRSAQRIADLLNDSTSRNILRGYVAELEAALKAHQHFRNHRFSIR
jgi:hypothetical protein